MKHVGRIIDIIFLILRYVIALLFATLVIATFLQVFNRFVLNASLTWSEEIANFAMMWVALLASVLLGRDKGHMAVNNVIDALSGVPKKVIVSISILLQVLFILAWLYGCAKFLPTVANRVSPSLSLPMGMVNSVFPISGVLMLLGMFDYWVVKGGREAAYSEEDLLLMQVQEEQLKERGED